MILYHGSNVKVTHPKIIESEVGRDFGPAFYLTPIKEQAERMAKRKVKITKQGTPIISIYEWDENKTDLSYKAFPEPDESWLDLIIKCRNNLKFHHTYDIVEGKIADDSVGETILFVLDGVIKKEDAIERLKFQKINAQIAFCSDVALKHITFKETYEVK